MADRLRAVLDVGDKILIPITVCLLGFFGNSILEEDQKRRAFVELLSRREEADSNLRKDMFSKVIDQFVGEKGAKLEARDPGSIETRILYLELLVNNFHESIDLGPLLKQVYGEVAGQSKFKSQRKRLQKLAEDIVARELDSLRGVSCHASAPVDLDPILFT